MRIVERELRPRYVGGVDYGADAVVLLRTDEPRGPRLLWHYAHKAWMDRLHGYQPAPARLVIARATPDEYVADEVLHEGGRLSRVLPTRSGWSAGGPSTTYTRPDSSTRSSRRASNRPVGGGFGFAARRG